MSDTLIPEVPDKGATTEPQHTESRRRKPAWERALEIARTVPVEERAVWPEDGSEQVDHYVYGTLKRD
jgi:hypothetical protein